MTTHHDTMTMLNANDPAFRERHPFGATIHDARGRHLARVMACDPLTGEAIIADLRPTPFDLVLRRFDRLLFRFCREQHWRFDWLPYSPHVKHRHGFWPAPLVVTPIEPEAQP
ncbi:MAG: hypothetical protein ACO218_07760 [Steroidobacteraceae bacterium]